MNELQLHRAVADYLGWALKPPAMFTTFPAGWSPMSKARSGQLRGAGLLAGMPDILVFWDSRTLGIELKTAKGKLTPEQISTHQRLADAMILVVVCHSVDEVEQLLKELHYPLRAELAA